MNGWFRFLVFLCLCSCKDKQVPLSLGNLKQAPELLRYTLWDTENEKFLSLPVLFDSRVIQNQGISKIIRRQYIIDTTESRTGKMLREERYYYFTNGGIEAVDLVNYYDDRKVGRMKIVYPNGGKGYGFKEAEVFSDSGATINRDFMDSGYEMHRLLKSRKHFLCFEEKSSGNKLFFMLNKHYWGPLSIDSILHPTPKDRIILGSPKYPVKSYSVRNKVREMDVTTYTYHPFLKRIRYIITEDFPFTTKRSFIYNSGGYCSAYVDSMFSSKKFLMRTYAQITLNAKGLPESIVKKRETAFRKLGLSAIEQFDYRY